MRVLVLWVACLVLVASRKNDTELKVDYYEKIIENAFEEMKTYKGRRDNSDCFEGVNENDEIEEYGSFDFVVVGGGSSGSVVASRLSEYENFTVLLLEAGKWNDDLVDIPYTSNILQYSDRNWGYFTTPQENGCLDSKDNRCPLASGKIIGGSGTIGYSVYVRGNKADFDHWESLGNPGWSYKDVLHLFKKLENFQSDEIDLESRGFAGPVNVQDIGYTLPNVNMTLITEAHAEIGVKTIADYNAKQELALSRIQTAIRCGRKQTGATSYVVPSETRHNFNVTINAFVTKILIDESTKSASGVHFVRNGKVYKAVANKEVILSAGSINTPQLLMLSGIGPEKDLKEHGIPVIMNLPVGKYVKDQVIFPLRFETNIRYPSKPFREYIKDYLDDEGLLTTYENLFAISFFNTRGSSFSVPNIEILHNRPSPICKKILPYDNLTEAGLKHREKIDQRTKIKLSIIALHPKSSGTISLQSKSPIDFPLIDVGLFENNDDMEVLYEGIKIGLKLTKTKAAQRISPKHIEHDKCLKHGRETKDYWLCAIRHSAHPGHHISSSAKMGPKQDPQAVVDNELCVHGVKNLRVADCSIMPTTISGQTMPIAFVIGGKLADLLKEEYGKGK